MRPIHPHIFEDVISKPRLDSYRGYFQTKSVDEAIGLYMWNSELSAYFSALLSCFEICLRNNTHRVMSQFYSRGVSSSDHWYDQIQKSLKPGTVSKIDDVRYEGPHHSRRLRNPQPGPDEIVSRVSFGFWPGVLSAIDARYADQLLSGIFPNHPLNANQADWKVASTRKGALAFIYELNEFRNRVAHHEPLWKFAAVMDTSVKPAVVVIPASRNQVDSLARFQRLLSFLDSAMAAMNHGFYFDMLNSSWRQKLNYLLSARGLARYKSLKHAPVDNNALTPTEFRRAFKKIVKHNQPVRIRRSNFQGVFIPD